MALAGRWFGRPNGQMGAHQEHRSVYGRMARSWTKLTPIEEEILRHLEEGASISEVARRMCYRRQTILYHIGVIQRVTGANPRTPEGLRQIKQRGRQCYE